MCAPSSCVFLCDSNRVPTPWTNSSRHVLCKQNLLSAATAPTLIFECESSPGWFPTSRSATRHTVAEVVLRPVARDLRFRARYVCSTGRPARKVLHLSTASWRAPTTPVVSTFWALQFCRRFPRIGAADSQIEQTWSPGLAVARSSLAARADLRRASGVAGAKGQSASTASGSGGAGTLVTPMATISFHL